MQFEVVILGSDINAYYMARSYYEKYQRKAFLLAKEKMNFTHLSHLLSIKYVGNIWEKEQFIKALLDFRASHPDRQLLLIPSNDFYVRLINENADILLQNNYVFHRNDLNLLNTFLIKDLFYGQYQNDILALPKTYIYAAHTTFDLAQVKDFMYPLILKPGNGVNYYKHHFEGQAKVYKIQSEPQLLDVISTIEASGYSDQLIIQEFIPGDDSRLFDCIMYVGSDGKVKLATFAQIGLQEHTKGGVGNLTVLVNGYSEFGNVEPEISKLIQFIEKSGYRGFCEFDLKYDIRDKSYKVFEINPRQARSSYYLTALGHNLVGYLVDDLIYKKPLDYHFLDQQIVLSFVPKKVIKEHIINPNLSAILEELISKGKITDPLDCPLEKHFRRSLWLKVRQYNYIKKYRQHQW